jgi:hypothetical protein
MLAVYYYDDQRGSIGTALSCGNSNSLWIRPVVRPAEISTPSRYITVNGTVPWQSFTPEIFAVSQPGVIFYFSTMIKPSFNQFSELHFEPGKYVMSYSVKSKGRYDG